MRIPCVCSNFPKFRKRVIPRTFTPNTLFTSTDDRWTGRGVGRREGVRGWSGNQENTEGKDKCSHPRHDAKLRTSPKSNLPDQLQLHPRGNEPTWAERAATDHSSHFQGTSDPGACPFLTDQRPPGLGKMGKWVGRKREEDWDYGRSTHLSDTFNI